MSSACPPFWVGRELFAKELPDAPRNDNLSFWVGYSCEEGELTPGVYSSSSTMHDLRDANLSGGWALATLHGPRSKLSVLDLHACSQGDPLLICPAEICARDRDDLHSEACFDEVAQHLHTFGGIGRTEEGHLSFLGRQQWYFEGGRNAGESLRLGMATLARCVPAEGQVDATETLTISAYPTDRRHRQTKLAEIALQPDGYGGTFYRNRSVGSFRLVLSKALEHTRSALMRGIKSAQALPDDCQIRGILFADTPSVDQAGLEDVSCRVLRPEDSAEDEAMCGRIFGIRIRSHNGEHGGTFALGSCADGPWHIETSVDRNTYESLAIVTPTAVLPGDFARAEFRDAWIDCVRVISPSLAMLATSDREGARGVNVVALERSLRMFVSTCLHLGLDRELAGMSVTQWSHLYSALRPGHDHELREDRPRRDFAAVANFCRVVDTYEPPRMKREESAFSWFVRHVVGATGEINSPRGWFISLFARNADESRDGARKRADKRVTQPEREVDKFAQETLLHHPAFAKRIAADPEVSNRIRRIAGRMVVWSQDYCASPTNVDFSRWETPLPPVAQVEPVQPQPVQAPQPPPVVPASPRVSDVRVPPPRRASSSSRDARKTAPVLAKQPKAQRKPSPPKAKPQAVVPVKPKKVEELAAPPIAAAAANPGPSLLSKVLAAAKPGSGCAHDERDGWFAIGPRDAFPYFRRVDDATTNSIYVDLRTSSSKRAKLPMKQDGSLDTELVLAGDRRIFDGLVGDIVSDAEMKDATCVHFVCNAGRHRSKFCATFARKFVRAQQAVPPIREETHTGQPHVCDLYWEEELKPVQNVSTGEEVSPRRMPKTYRVLEQVQSSKPERCISSFNRVRWSQDDETTRKIVVGEGKRFICSVKVQTTLSASEFAAIRPYISCVAVLNHGSARLLRKKDFQEGKSHALVQRSIEVRPRLWDALTRGQEVVKQPSPRAIAPPIAVEEPPPPVLPKAALAQPTERKSPPRSASRPKKGAEKQSRTERKRTVEKRRNAPASSERCATMAEQVELGSLQPLSFPGTTKLDCENGECDVEMRARVEGAVGHVQIAASAFVLGRGSRGDYGERSVHAREGVPFSCVLQRHRSVFLNAFYRAGQNFSDETANRCVCTLAYEHARTESRDEICFAVDGLVGIRAAELEPLKPTKARIQDVAKGFALLDEDLCLLPESEAVKGVLSVTSATARAVEGASAWSGEPLRSERVGVAVMRQGHCGGRRIEGARPLLKYVGSSLRATPFDPCDDDSSDAASSEANVYESGSDCSFRTASTLW